jgi:succinoglycan biosynthesis transport protein ExoP
MSRVTRSPSLEFGATEPHPEGFAERNSFFSGLLSRVFGAAQPSQGAEDLSPPRAIGEVPRPASMVASAPAEHMAAPAQTLSAAPYSPTDEIERLVLHVAASDRPARVRRVLLTHVVPVDAPLAGLDCAAFASQFARALSLEGRTILVIFGAGSGRRLGLSELVSGTASFSEAIHRETGSRLHILPPGHSRTLPGEGLNGVMDALAETYDFVVLAALDEDQEASRALALWLAPRADQVVIACEDTAQNPDVMVLRDALRGAGAGDVLAARMGSTRAQTLAA